MGEIENGGKKKSKKGEGKVCMGREKRKPEKEREKKNINMEKRKTERKKKEGCRVVSRLGREEPTIAL